MDAPSNMKVVLGVVFDPANQVLLIRRASENRWLFPGGKVEHAETEEAAVVREVAEEGGVRCDVESFIGRRIHPHAGRELSYWRCSASAQDPDPMNPAEIAEARWFSIEAALSLLGETIFPPARETLQARVSAQ